MRGRVVGATLPLRHHLCLCSVEGHLQGLPPKLRKSQDGEGWLRGCRAPVYPIYFPRQIPASPPGRHPHFAAKEAERQRHRRGCQGTGHCSLLVGMGRLAAPLQWHAPGARGFLPSGTRPPARGAERCCCRSFVAFGKRQLPDQRKTTLSFRWSSSSSAPAPRRGPASSRHGQPARLPPDGGQGAPPPPAPRRALGQRLRSPSPPPTRHLA